MRRVIRHRADDGRGFTLAELLIVVAIIAVLVAIAIPVFSTQLESSREATDCANVRSAYSDAMAKYMLATADQQKAGVESDTSITVKQLNEGWTNASLDWSFLGSSSSQKDKITPGATLKVKITAPSSTGSTIEPTVELVSGSSNPSNANTGDGTNGS